jgi:hypothetical protein
VPVAAAVAEVGGADKSGIPDLVERLRYLQSADAWLYRNKGSSRQSVLTGHENRPDLKIRLFLALPRP